MRREDWQKVYQPRQGALEARVRQTLGTLDARTDGRTWTMKKTMALALAAVLLYFPHTKAGQSIQAYDVLTTYLEQPELQMDLTARPQRSRRLPGSMALRRRWRRSLTAR